MFNLVLFFHSLDQNVTNYICLYVVLFDQDPKILRVLVGGTTVENESGDDTTSMMDEQVCYCTVAFL